MKKNGYLRSFLALFLAFVMIMADSSVTTFAATVGRVRKQKAVIKNLSQVSLFLIQKYWEMRFILVLLLIL